MRIRLVSEDFRPSYKVRYLADQRNCQIFYVFIIPGGLTGLRISIDGLKKSRTGRRKNARKEVTPRDYGTNVTTKQIILKKNKIRTMKFGLISSRTVYVLVRTNTSWL